MHFLIFSIFDVLRIFEALQMFFNKFLLKWGKNIIKLKNIILFLNRGLIFFSNGHIRNVVSKLPNVAKINVENDNVVFTLSNVVQFNLERHNVVQRCKF